MSVEALSLVLHHSKASGTAKLVLLGIANHYGDGGAWPAVSTLSKYANSTERTVQRSIQELVELGELRVEYRSGGFKPSAYATNRYWLNLVCPEECDRSANHKDRGDTGVTPEVTLASPLEVTRTSPKPSLEPSEKPSPYARQVERGDFEAFWKAYPRKAGKQAAAKAYQKALDAAAPEEILAGATRYANDPNRHEAYTAHAATWLNAGRWDDEPLPERQLTKEEREAKEQAEREARWKAEKERRALEAEEREAEIRRAEEARATVKRCEHDRILYACRICAPKALAEATN